MKDGDWILPLAFVFLVVAGLRASLGWLLARLDARYWREMYEGEKRYSRRLRRLIARDRRAWAAGREPSAN